MHGTHSDGLRQGIEQYRSQFVVPVNFVED